MCGILGVVFKDGDLAEAEYGNVKKMATTLIHRGPDGSGFLVGSNFVLAHLRLSIIDLSSAGAQPMDYMDKYSITFNGEIYNYLELKQELEARGYVFRTHTDTEVIMAAYDCWGVECQNKFNGMWSFVIVDKNKNRIFISRDRFGIKPLYYYKDEEYFIFASEIKALLEHNVVPRCINKDVCLDFIKNGDKQYTRETIFSNIFRFQFGAYIEEDIDVFLQGELKEKTYWTLNINTENEVFSQEKASRYARNYYAILKDAVKIRLRSDVKVGSALSGGLDSSSIVYIISNELKELSSDGGLQETFSSVYKSNEVKHCDESHLIEKLAGHLNVKSNVIEPNVNDIIEEHRKFIYYLDTPPDNTLMSSWHTYRLVRQKGVTVTLDGQGADEQLAGYLAYVMRHSFSMNIAEFVSYARSFIAIPGINKYLFVGFVISILKTVIGKKHTKSILDYFAPSLRFNYCLNTILADDLKHALVNLFHYADRGSMAFSVESRMPFMDYRLVEFLAGVPACYKIHSGFTKYLARIAFDNKLPADIVWRKDKMGWPIPEDYWFNGPLKNILENTIQTSALFDKISYKIDKKMDELSLKQKIRLFNLATWHAIFFEKPEKII
jgi:asparagine synthase (glutamine-hydrolysing)